MVLEKIVPKTLAFSRLKRLYDLQACICIHIVSIKRNATELWTTRVSNHYVKAVFN